MRSQDDTTFASQQFAGQVAARRNEIADRQIDLNMRAGDLSRQAMESWQSGGRYAMDEGRYQMQQAESAVNLTGGELRIQQAREELDWAKQIHDVTARANYIARDRAQTALVIAQSKKALRELQDYQPEYATNILARAGMIASGIKPTYNHTKGGWDYEKPSEQDQQDALRLVNAVRGRAGARATDPNIEASRELEMKHKMVELARIAYENDDKEAGDRWMKEAGIKPVQEQEKPKPLPPQWDNPQIGANNSRAVFQAAQENLDVLRDAFKQNARHFEEAGHKLPTDEEVLNWLAGEMRNYKSPFRALMLKFAEADGKLNRSEMDLKGEMEGHSTFNMGGAAGQTLR